MAKRLDAVGIAAMTIWQDSLDTIYTSELAVDATFSAGTAGSGLTLRMLDKTVGIEVGEPDNPQVTTVLPAAYVRMAELTSNGLTRADVDGATVNIAGQDWRVKAHILRPRPDGQVEVCMFLIGAPANG